MNLRKKNHFSWKLTDFLNSLHQSIKEDVGWFLKKKKKKEDAGWFYTLVEGIELDPISWGQSAINPKIKERPKCKMSTKNKKTKIEELAATANVIKEKPTTNLKDVNSN